MIGPRVYASRSASMSCITVKSFGISVGIPSALAAARCAQGGGCVHRRQCQVRQRNPVGREYPAGHQLPIPEKPTWPQRVGGRSASCRYLFLLVFLPLLAFSVLL